MHRPDALLRRHPLLVRFDDEQLARFAAAGEMETFEPDEVVVSEGGLGDSLYLILSGTCEVTREGRTLATLGSGEFFGEMSMVEPVPRSATVRAVDDARLFRVPHGALHNLLEEDPYALNLMLVAVVKVLSERLRETNRKLTSVGELADWLAGSLV